MFYIGFVKLINNKLNVMGFFKSFFSSEEATTFKASFSNEVEASFAILYAAINADGQMDDMEIDALARAVTLKSSFQGYNSDGYFGKARELSIKIGNSNLLQQAAEMLTTGTKKAVFVMAVDMLLSNGSVNAQENQFINELNDALGLDKEWSMQAAEIILLKYN